MEVLTTNLSENQQALDTLLGAGRNYDVISRESVHRPAKGPAVRYRRLRRRRRH